MNSLEKDIIDYTFSEDKQRFISGRCAKSILEKRNWYNYLINKYNDNSTASLIEVLYRIKYGIDEIPKCKICGKPLKFTNGSYPNYCSAKCRNNDPNVIAKNKEGVSKSLKAAYKERGDEIKEKRAKTLEEKYGTSGNSSPFSFVDVQNKVKSTILNNYGVDNIMRLSQYHANTKEIARRQSAELWKQRGLDIEYTDYDTVIIKNGCKIHGDIELDIHAFNNRTKPERMQVSEICPECNPLFYNSGKEILMMKFFDELGIKYTANDRKIIKPLELDFYFPDYNIAIEINGIYFHGELSSKPSDYHKNKSEACEKQGVQLIHIWEDDLIQRKDLIFSMLKNKFGKSSRKIGARQCEIRIVSSKDATSFLNDNHLQGAINAKYKFGLYYNDELVSLMTFGNLRKALGAKKDETTCELYRFCNKAEVSVQGGASKLFEYAKKVLSSEGFKKIITYAKRDWSNGELYKNLGFEFDGYTVPGYFWTNTRGQRLNRFACRKSEIAKTDEEKNMTEVEIMHTKGFFRCYDSGNLKFHYCIC